MEQFRLFAFHIGVSRLARGQKNAITRCCKVRAGLSDRRWKSSNTITLSLLRPPCLQRNTVTALSTHPRSTLAASVTWARRAGTAMATGTGRHSLLWLHELVQLWPQEQADTHCFGYMSEKSYAWPQEQADTHCFGYISEKSMATGTGRHSLLRLHER